MGRWWVGRNFRSEVSVAAGQVSKMGIQNTRCNRSLKLFRYIQKTTLVVTFWCIVQPDRRWKRRESRVELALEHQIEVQVEADWSLEHQLQEAVLV